MIFGGPSHSNRSHASRSRARKPSAEGLEDRLLLYATLGGQWAYGSRITYSFVPDGTSIGGIPSTLYQSLANRGFSTQDWQQQFQNAAAVWEQFANINLVQVSDTGADFSVAGNQQGDPRFGDIRIAATDLGSSVLAMCYLPPKFNGGTLAGDIVINSTMAWQINSDYDLESVAIHEIGHSLGMDHSTISQAVMYASYTGLKQSLNTDDVAGIQSLYQARQSDAFEPNNSVTKSASITSYIDANSQIRLANLDVSTTYDNDWFTVVAPANAVSTMTVSMQSTNLSSLSPKLLVYNSGLSLLGSDSKPNTYGATATVTVTGVTPGQRFYFRAGGANYGPTSSGGYGLLVNFGSGSMAPIAPPNTVVLEKANQGGGSSNQTIGPIASAMGFGSAIGTTVLGSNTVQIGDLVGVGETLAHGSANGRPLWKRDLPYLMNGQRGGADASDQGQAQAFIGWFVGLDGVATAETANGSQAGSPRRNTSSFAALDEALDNWGSGSPFGNQG